MTVTVRVRRRAPLIATIAGLMDTSTPLQSPAPAPILQFFAYEHLPPHLQAVSKPIGDLARQIESQLPPGAETSAGLRKLLEAKDCFVRAAIAKK